MKDLEVDQVVGHQMATFGNQSRMKCPNCTRFMSPNESGEVDCNSCGATFRIEADGLRVVRLPEGQP